MARSLDYCMFSLVFFSLEMESGVIEKDLNAICRLKIKIVQKFCESIRFWSSKGAKGEELDLLVVMVLANLINYLISNQKLK